MRNILIIPLDSRPCNTRWLSVLGKQADLDVIMYPRHLCGNLHKGANFAAMMDFIDENIANCDYLLIAADGLCSGGLVQARLGLIDVAETIKALAVFEKYKNAYPHIRIYAFDTIMRTSVTAYDEKTAHYWNLVNEYSRLYGNNGSDEVVRLNMLEKQIPDDVLKTYLRARAIKHKLNVFFLEQVKKNIVDYLLILQEDASSEGMHKKEQERLTHYIADNNIGDRVKVHNGADEGGLLLLGRIINEIYRRRPGIFLYLPKKKALEKIMPYEDRPFILNLRAMFETVGLRIADDEEKADFILALYAEEHNYNLHLSAYDEIKPAAAAGPFADGLNAYLCKHKNVAFVDLLFPNGGSPEILRSIDYRQLKVYSAWNTACNSLGSALAEIALLAAKPGVNHENFKNERILDDCVYQYIVRRKINEDLLKRRYNIYDLGDYTSEVTNEIIKQMTAYNNVIDGRDFALLLPWGRTFEIDIEIEE